MKTMDTYRIEVLTSSVIKIANECAVLTGLDLRDFANTSAPIAYESFVANVTHACPN